jgi:hypothetical protein
MAARISPNNARSWNRLVPGWDSAPRRGRQRRQAAPETPLPACTGAAELRVDTEAGPPHGVDRRMASHSNGPIRSTPVFRPGCSRRRNTGCGAVAPSPAERLFGSVLE